VRNRVGTRIAERRVFLAALAIDIRFLLNDCLVAWATPLRGMVGRLISLLRHQHHHQQYTVADWQLMDIELVPRERYLANDLHSSDS